MPDDERTRRPRVGDETKERIENLASGWSVGSEPTPEPKKPDATPARKKQKTLPPPPPGSDERAQLEKAIVAATPTPQPEPRAKPVSVPPPIPPARAKPATAPPPIPPAAIAPKQVPRGEFDAGFTHVDEDKRRIQYAQETIQRDAADALLHIAAASPPPSRGDPASIDAGTSPFERGDPTTMQRPDHKPFDTEQPTVGAKIRPAAALRRQRGVAGDVRYVFTALFGVRRSRRELAELEAAQERRAQSRRHHLVTLGRTAATADAFAHPALARAREQLQKIEDERSQHAGAVAAADAELERVRRDREAKAKAHAETARAIDGELAELAKKLEPLEKDAANAKKRGTGLRESINAITAKIAAAEARLVSVKGPREDRAAVDAEIASLKADRISVQRDEPAIAAELDALYPRIASIDAARADARKRKTDRERDEADDQRRSAELLEAIGAKRKVVERAAADAEAARDRTLFELAERLCVDRPPILGAQLAPIDAIDLEMGAADRQAMELREILQNVDKAKLARGAAVIAVVVLAVGAFAVWLAMRLL